MKTGCYISWILLLLFLSISAVADSPPVISYFSAQPNPVYLDGTAIFTIEAIDDIGIERVYFYDSTTGITEESNRTPAEFMKEFNSTGTYRFCASARDTSGQGSNTLCINVSVFIASECEPLTMQSDNKTVQIATKIRTKRIYKETSGFDGYPIDCCPYCKNILINNSNCGRIGGNLLDYKIIQYNYSINTTYQNLTFPENIFLGEIKYPVILCSARINENLSNIGVIDGSKYQPIEFVYNEKRLKYWIIQNTELGEDKYFLAEQDHIGDEKTYMIVDAKNYSIAVNELMKNEYYYKVPESGECQFDCPDFDPRCDYSCTCGGGMALGCPSCPPQTCECCMQFHKVYDYNESIYRKYEEMYGRPYTDYLFCYRTPLKDTAWCYQRMDVSTSTINYPWYAFTIEDTKTYAPRNTEKIDEEYINEIHDWNLNQEIKEKPVKSAIKEKTWVPETYCDWNFNSKLFRNIWAKIFTVTPYLEDYRNDIEWTKTGPGTIYAGGGFRREAACWWECCRRCGTFCNCDCAPCAGICCLNAYYTSGVLKTMKFTVPEVIINDTTLIINPPPGEYAKEVTVSNGALTVISTGNMEFTITSAIFTKDPIKGIYTLTLNYLPESNYRQFVIAEDIVLNYRLPENATQLFAKLDETFTTSLGDVVCGCTPIPVPPFCLCLTSGYVPITTTESVSDAIGTAVAMDEIKIDALKQAANGFVDIVVGKGIDVGLVAFSQSPYCPSGICSSHPLSMNTASLHSQINSYAPVHGTCISCGINKGRDLLSGRTDHRYMIVMSDGVPNCCLGGGVCPPNTAKAEAISEASAAKGENITVHTVALGDDADQPFMQQLANAGGGNFYYVTCDCPLECIYNTLANLVNNSVVLVNDISGSMSLRQSLDCPGKGLPIIYKFGRVNITITGNIDNYADRFMTQNGFLNITIMPDIMNKFILNVRNLSLIYSSLEYPIKHNLYRKEFVRGQWIPGIPYAVGHLILYGYMPGEEYYFLNTSYGYEERIPSAVGFEFKYPEQGKEICPPECFCPEYDITDVTCGNYTTQPPTYYKRSDCICAETSQIYKRPITSTRTYHEEETYYYDFANLVTFEKENLSVMGSGTELKPVPPVGGLSGEVEHLTKKELVPTYFIYIANSADNTVSKVRTSDCVEECRYDVGKNPSRTAVSLNKEVWVGNRDSGDVSKLDASSCNVINESIKVGSGPRAIAVDEDNNVWVGNANDDNVWKLNGSTGNKILQTNVGDYPYGAVVDCKGYVWVLSTNDDKLTKIRTSDGFVVGSYSIGGETYGIGIDSNGDIWLGGAGSGNVYKVDGSTGNVICKEKVGGYTRGIALDMNDNAWVADYGAKEVIKVNGSNCHQVLGRYPVGDGPIGVAIDFEGNVWVPNYGSNNAFKLNSTNGAFMCKVNVGNGPYTYSDMTGFGLWHVCKNRTFEGVLEVKNYPGQYLLNFNAFPFPYQFNKSDFEDSSITIFIHFRNDAENQTFKLFPPHKESKPYAVIDINVTMRDQSRILIENVTPGRYNLKPGTLVKTDLKLIDAITNEKIKFEDIAVEVEAYKIGDIITTDNNGIASFSFVIGGDSTKINFIYSGNDKFLQSRTSDYYDVTSTERIWWFLSPEVLLLIIVLVLIAFSYRWFKRGRFDIYKIWEELKGK